MKHLFRLRLVLVIGSTFPGCLATSSGSSLPAFRHPLFHRQEAVEYTPGPKFDWSVKTSWPKSSCTRSFGHPLLNRCQTWPQEVEKKLAVYRIPAGQDAIDVRLALSKKARDMIKKPKFNVAGRQYRRDCSGFVLAVMAQQGIAGDVLLVSDFKGGVAAIFNAAVKRGLVHKRKTPAIGDLVFFDNTYDRNRDGRLNDPLTHIGIVERVDADGTVTFIHHVKRGILRYKMNLFTPNLRRDSKTNKVLNHYIRVASKSAADSSRKLTGELFHAYATIIR